jgi:hypothetical protein
VIAPCTSEVVSCAGGWLFDQVMAGWDVTVYTGDPVDSRPLRILGTTAASLENWLAAAVRGPVPHAIAVRADLYDSDARVREFVLAAAGEGTADLWLWGDGYPPDLDNAADPVRHRLSSAARAFKAQALAAAAAPVTDDVAEVFRAGTTRRLPPVTVR